MLHAWQSPPLFTDNVGQPLGAADVNVLEENAVLLDAASFIAAPCGQSTAGKDTNTPGYYATGGREWWGSFQYFTGMTTLVAEGWGQKGASESFQLIVNGVVKQTLAVPNGAAWSMSWTISGLVDGDVAEVEIRMTGTGWGGSGVVTKYVFYDVYVTPAPSVASSWPGSPSFAGTYRTSLLNQLINGEAYLYDRLNVLPLLPSITQLYSHGSSGPDTYPLWYGSVERSNGNTLLFITIRPMNMGNQAEVFKITVNGTVVYTSSSFGVGYAASYDLQLDLSGFAANTRLEAKIEQIVTTGPLLGPGGDRNTRFFLGGIRMGQTAPAVASPLTAFTANESLISTTVDGSARLSGIAAILSGVKSRLDANPRIFNRVRLMRRMYGRDPNQYAAYAPNNTYVQQFTRTGSRLVVRGKGVSIAWGALSTKADKTTTGSYKVDFAHTQSLMDGDAVQTKTVYLDSIPGLQRGMTYVVIGENVVYAAEYLA